MSEQDDEGETNKAKQDTLSDVLKGLGEHHIFPECLHVLGLFSGACAICKGPDQALDCSGRNEHLGNEGLEV